jgi:hypothetical protein
MGPCWLDNLKVLDPISLLWGTGRYAASPTLRIHDHLKPAVLGVQKCVSKSPGPSARSAHCLPSTSCRCSLMCCQELLEYSSVTCSSSSSSTGKGACKLSRGRVAAASRDWWQHHGMGWTTGQDSAATASPAGWPGSCMGCGNYHMTCIAPLAPQEVMSS